MTVRVPLSRGLFAVVDDSDAEWILSRKWYAEHSYNGSYYARTAIYDQDTKKCKMFTMHRMIMGAVKGQEVDHIDRDKLNNIRSNLRFCTHRQNLWNKKATAYSKTGAKGVILTKSGTFEVSIKLAGKRTHLGTYAELEEAAAAYATAARLHHGEFARW